MLYIKKKNLQSGEATPSEPNVRSGTESDKEP